MGTTKKLLVDRDLDTTIDLIKVETVLYKDMTDDDFIKQFNSKLSKCLCGNYVFLCLNKSGWTKWASGENAYVLKIAARKKYLIGKR